MIDRLFKNKTSLDLKIERLELGINLNEIKSQIKERQQANQSENWIVRKHFSKNNLIVAKKTAYWDKIHDFGGRHGPFPCYPVT